MNNINKSLSINETYIIDSIDDNAIFSACTALYTNNIISCSGNTQIDLGENLIVFNGNTLATIISATTYYGDGSNLTGISTQDTFVTGGTYSNGTAVFTNNTGGTFTVTGFYTGSTTPFDVFVTGGTYSNGIAIFTNNTGGTFTVTGFSTSNATQFTGGTVTGATFFTNGLTTNTISATTYQNLPKIKYVINVAKEGGDFTSIKAAVDSITDSNSENRYVVKVAPGRYVEDNIVLQGKEFVSIVGTDILETLVVAANPNQYIFTLGNNNELSFMTISGASNGVGIVCYNLDGFSLVHKISMYDCNTNVLVQSDSANSNFYGEYMDFNGTYSYGTRVLAYNGYIAYANIENYYNYPTGPNPTIANSVQGSGATLSVFVGDGISNGVAGSTNYEILDYASLNTTTTTAEGWDYCLRNPNIGGPVRFDIDSLSVVDSLTYDISIEHPDTFGTFNGSSTHTKIHTLSPNIYWSFLDSNDGEFEITRKMSVTFQDGTHTDASTLIFEGSTMGLIDGGVITHVSGLTFQVSSGFGYLEKTTANEVYVRLDWNASQITLSPNSENYLYFNENNILSTSSNEPDNTTNIILGRVVTDASSVRFIDATPYNSSHTSNLLSTFNRNALGPIYATGSLVTQNATPYHLNISAGDYYFSENNFLPSGGTNVTFTQYLRDGSTGWITSATTVVVNGYDNNTGMITSLPTSAFTKHSLYVVGQGVNEKYMLVLGQTYYSTLVAAEGADLPTPPNYFDDGVAPIASIYIQQGLSGITQIQDIRPVIGFKAAGVSATAVHGNLLGLTSDDHKQYLLVDGSRAMTGNLSMGGNAVVSGLTYNGVTIESHASRHKNGGADEIATATPAPSEIPKADTFGKLDGWISDASTSVKGLTRLSQAPASATVPIAVGVNDSRFLSSITGVTNTTPSLVFTNNSGGTTTISNITLSSVSATTISATTYVGLPTDIRVTGGTYSNGTATFRNNTGGTFTVTGLTTPFTGGTVSGATRFTGGVTANTISATTYFNLPTDIRVTGGTYVSGTGITTFTNNTGGTFNVSGYFKPTDDIYVDGGSVSHGPSTDNNRLSLNRSDSTTVYITDLVDISEVTKSDMDTIISEKTVIRGKTYRISGCDQSLYLNGNDSKGSNVYTTLYLLGLENNLLSEDGIGVFYTPKYDNYNIFTDGAIYAKNDIVIWGGFVWVCNSDAGLPSNALSIFQIDSSFTVKRPFIEGSFMSEFYNVNYDTIKYDYSNDRIIYRDEANVNLVSTSYDNILYWLDTLGWNPISVFQWGHLYDFTHNKGIGNQKIINSYNENINFNGKAQYNFELNNYSYINNINANISKAIVDRDVIQSNFKLDNNSSISNITLEGASYQDMLFLNNLSSISTTSLSKNSYQTRILLDNRSSIEQSILNNGGYQKNISLKEASSFYNIRLNHSTYQEFINLDNHSYFSDIYIEQSGGYQTNINLTNSSYLNNVSFGVDCYQDGINLSNASYLNNITFINKGKFSVQSNFNFDNGSSQDTITLRDIVQDSFNFTNGSRQYNMLCAHDQQWLIFDAGSQFNNLNGQQLHITIKGYDRNLNTQTGAEDGLFFIHNLPNTLTSSIIGKVDNQLVEVLGLTYDNNVNQFVFTEDINSTAGLYFNQISGTTYLGLPIDVVVTGGTYNSGGGVITFTNNTGGTFNVTGITAGGSAFTGGTVSGPTTFTNGVTSNTISATTYFNLPTDIRVTGGTYDSGTNIITFTNNTGGTFTVTGITSGGGSTFTGGTVSGPTRFTSGLTANTISATTYVNLPIKYYAEFSATPSTSPSVTAANSIAIGSNALASASNMFVAGFNAGANTSGTTFSTFIGTNAGINATDSSSAVFIGGSAGWSSNNAPTSNFIGNSAGWAASGSSFSNFLGNVAGQYATNSSNSNFFGNAAGQYANNSPNSIFIGQSAGQYSSGSTVSIFIGQNAGYSATSSSNSIFLGYNAGKNVVGAVGSNNIIIGSNISLPAATTNSINIGGVLFGTGINSTLGATPILTPINGKIGINVVTPNEALHVSGNTRIQGGLTANTISATTYFNLPSSTFTGGTVAGATTFSSTLTVSGNSALNGGISSTSLSGTTDRMVQVSSGGTVSASIPIISAYLTSGSTVANLLENTANWDINGVYTGTSITGTYQGQKHYNGDYFFEAVADNLFIRLIRG